MELCIRLTDSEKLTGLESVLLVLMTCQDAYDLAYPIKTGSIHKANNKFIALLVTGFLHPKLRSLQNTNLCFCECLKLSTVL